MLQGLVFVLFMVAYETNLKGALSEKYSCDPLIDISGNIKYVQAVTHEIARIK